MKNPQHPSPSPKVVIAGGTGFLGLNLAHYLKAKNYEVVLVSRHTPKASMPFQHAVWDSHRVGEWKDHLENAAALVNLAGRTVDCIKTPDHCDEILRSRVESTRVLGQALRQISHPPAVWVQMSTAHIYGDPPKRICDEDAAFGYGLAPEVGKAWEKAFEEAILPEMRGVILRTSFVMGRSGGALKQLAALARFGLGGKIGHGQQGMSWIHEQDMNELFYQSIINPDMKGAYLATAPQPVSNRDFMREMRKALNIPFGLPATAWMVKLGAHFLLRTDPELALYGRYCKSRRLEEEGFEFEYPEIECALKNLFAEKYKQLLR